MASAEDVGKKLLGEVEECGLDEMLREIHFQHGSRKDHFNFPPFDRLLRDMKQSGPQTSRSLTSQPTIELMSLGVGDGKTHLLYHLCALAVLPRSMSGKQECVVIVDTDGKFFIQRLAAHVQLLLHRYLPTDSTEHDSEDKLIAETVSALKHIHIFRSQNLVSIIDTLDALPTYLFDQDRHYSFDREVAFIALDSASAFYWQDRAETETAAFLAKTQAGNVGNQISDYFTLATALKIATKTLDCPAIFTTWYLGPQQKARDGATPRAFRPQIRPLQASFRLVVHRVPVRKFPAGLSLGNALREAADRQKAVAEGQFECFVNEWSAEEGPLRQQSTGSFEFRIVGDGSVVAQDESTGQEPT